MKILVGIQKKKILLEMDGAGGGWRRTWPQSARSVGWL